jgi:hypothetical protein
MASADGVFTARSALRLQNLSVFLGLRARVQAFLAVLPAGCFTRYASLRSDRASLQPLQLHQLHQPEIAVDTGPRPSIAGGVSATRAESASGNVSAGLVAPEGMPALARVRNASLSSEAITTG